MKITQKTVKALTMPPGKTDHIVWDDTPGFGLRLRASTGKVTRTWVCQYRVNGRTRRVLLGSAEVIKTDQARSLARQVLGRVANGEDPQGDKQDRRNQGTLREIVHLYLADVKPTVRPRSFTEKRRYLTGPYFKPLHAMPIDGIKRADVAIRLNRIVAENGPVVASLARAQFSALFTWALTQGLAESNPVIGTLAPKAGKPRERVLTDTELASIWRACGGDDHYSKVIKLLILTGCRREEVGGMTWKEVDLVKGLWTLPAERSKNYRPHTLPIMPEMLSIIRGTPRMASTEALFGPFVSWSRGKRSLDDRSGVKDWTVHDLRRSVATRMADVGVEPHIIEQVLNHRSGHKRGVAGTYNHSRYERAVRSALSLWHDHLHALITGGERKVVFMQQEMPLEAERSLA